MIRILTAYAALFAAVPLNAGEAADVVGAQNAAYIARDLDAFIATYNDNAVVMIDGQVYARGSDEIRAIYAPDFKAQLFEAEIRSIEEDGYLVTVTEAMRFRNGKVVCCSVAEYEVFNGKISVLNMRLPEGWPR